MNTSDTNITKKLIYPKLSYAVVGICFTVHNELSNFAKEKQYCNQIEKQLKLSKIPYKRELNIGNSGNIIDFLVDHKIILEIKAKRIITKNDYFQIQRYLQESHIKLGILINFRDKYIKPHRVVRIDKN